MMSGRRSKQTIGAPTLLTQNGPGPLRELRRSIAAAVAANHAFADAGHESCLAGPRILPAEACWFWWQTFFHLEVPDYEGER